jgi:epoxyqueuosine reductase
MTVIKSVSLEDEIKQLAKEEGAVLVGICSADSIKDKEFSDASFLLPEAQSVISIALAFSEKAVKNYLAKIERDSFNIEDDQLTKGLRRIGEKIKNFLEEKGYKAYNGEINYDYRNNKVNQAQFDLIFAFRELELKDSNANYEMSRKEQKKLNMLRKTIENPEQRRKMAETLVPDFSHRCAAVAAGLGRVGWSGNIVTEDYGARVLFNSIITDAKLTPDSPMEQNPCNKCKLCEKVCQSGFFSLDEGEQITIAGVEETIGKRKSVAYCCTICAGLACQNRFPEFSTWSPYPPVSLPSEDKIDDFMYQLNRNLILSQDPEDAEYMLKFVRCIVEKLHNKPTERYLLTCSHCQLVCGPTMKDKKDAYKSVIDAGVIYKPKN